MQWAIDVYAGADCCFEILYTISYVYILFDIN